MLKTETKFPESFKNDILNIFGIESILRLYTNATQEALQKSILKLMKVLIENGELLEILLTFADRGKILFEQANGIKIFTDSLDTILKCTFRMIDFLQY